MRGAGGAGRVTGVPTSEILTPNESRQLREYVRQLAQETASTANVAIRVTNLAELIGSVQATVEVTIHGNFEDEKVAESLVGKFHSKPWSAPIAKSITFDHDDQRLILTACAFVPGDRLHPTS